MGAVFKWLAGVALKVVGWAIAHPIAAIVVGIGLGVAALWLKEQPWAGADMLSNLVGTVGVTIGVYGIGGWIAQKIAWTVVRAVKHVGQEIGKAFVKLTTSGAPDRWIIWSRYWRP